MHTRFLSQKTPYFGIFILAVTLPSITFADDSQELAFFESKIRPILVEKCQSCHGPKKQKGGLRVDSRPAILKGGDSGPAVVVGKPDESLLVRAVKHLKDDLQMPPDNKLKPEQIGDLVRWVKNGLIDPRDKPVDGEAVQVDWPTISRERAKWWSLQRLRPINAPEVDDPEWTGNEVDRFIRAKQKQSALSVAPQADRRTLARRLSFLLTGLPPSEEQIKSFLDDELKTGAEEKFVDRLLDSPHFGERFARHWMDVVRYGDTYGYEWDIPAKGSWRYRDYLIRAFNNDIPFNQLVREQLAGDLLKEPRWNRAEGINESLIGPMFYQLGEKRHGDSAMFNGIHQEMLHNKIDAFSKAFQATTVGCAQCHDHKLDAVSQKDYYAIAGMFFSPRWVSVTIDSPERNRETIDKLRAMKPAIRGEVGRWWLNASKDFAGRIRKFEEPKTPVGIENPMHVWFALAKADREKKSVADRWNELAKEYSLATQNRIAGNKRDFKVVADFRQSIPPDWSVDGVGFRDGPVKSGEFNLSMQGPAIVGRVMPAGLFSDAISPRLNGVVRSPLLRNLELPHLSVQVAGGEFAAERTIIDNAFVAERQTYLANVDPAYRLYGTMREQKDRRNYVEFATKTSNPNFPPRVGLGGACTDAQIADPTSWLGVTQAVAHTGPNAPLDELGRFSKLFEGKPPVNLDEASARLAKWLTSSAIAWSQDKATDEDVVVINWLLRNQLLPNSEKDAPEAIRKLRDSYRQLEKQIQDPQTVNGMAEVDPADDYRLNIRGDYDRPTKPIPRGYLEVFPKTSPNGGQSGRLELAEFIASSRNPLTARVYVNRVWQWVFGSGLVASPDDFGHLGESPSNPELLDWLANWFIQNGWSTKKLVRKLVNSRTFRQSGTPDPNAIKLDPKNRLLHHMAMRRLEAEEVRDAMLFASGRLDRKLYGPTVNPYRTHEDPEKRLFSGPVDGEGRRSIYTKVTIMEPPQFLAVFNQPPPKIPTGKRDISNGPAQALAMLNDPFVLGQADFWGAQLAKSGSKTIESRLDSMFQIAMGRSASPDELNRWTLAVREFASDHAVLEAGILTSQAVWKDVAHAMFNVKEFIYVR